MSEQEPFLSRWSRRKATGGTDAPTEAGARPSADETAEAAAAEPLSLPDIDDLDTGSDFSAFMQPGVPDDMRKRALRKLWTIDPELSRPDGMVEYGEDYAAAFRIERVVETAWRLGKGMPDPMWDETGDTDAAERSMTADVNELPEDEGASIAEEEP